MKKEKDYILNNSFNIMGKYLSQLKQQTLDGLIEFSEHPINYSFNATKDFVKNYWDMGASILAGCAFDDYHNHVFGDARGYLMMGGFLAGIFGSMGSEKRLLRNFYAGLSGALGFPLVRGANAPKDIIIINTALSGLSAIISLYLTKLLKKEAINIKSSELQSFIKTSEQI